MKRKEASMDCTQQDYGWIYLFINKINNKKYVGQTWNIQRRIREHITGQGCAKLLKLAIEKYGINSFEVVKLQKANTQEELDSMEIKLIEVLNTLQPNGYNLAKGGARGKHSEETKKLIGSYHKDKLVSAETRKKISEKNKGKSRSNEVREQISKTNKEAFKNVDRPIYLFDCITHELKLQFKNMYELQNKIAIPVTRIHGSLSAKSSFELDGNYFYARYINEPLDKQFTFGRQVIVIKENGEEIVYQSKVAAEKSLGLGRGVIDSLVRGKVQRSTCVENGSCIKISAKYYSPCSPSISNE